MEHPPYTVPVQSLYDPYPPSTILFLGKESFDSSTDLFVRHAWSARPNTFFQSPFRNLHKCSSYRIDVWKYNRARGVAMYAI
jgi:hypothetical protein